MTMSFNVISANIVLLIIVIGSPGDTEFFKPTILPTLDDTNLHSSFYSLGDCIYPQSLSYLTLYALSFYEYVCLNLCFKCR